MMMTINIDILKISQVLLSKKGVRDYIDRRRMRMMDDG
jgi:hypothetical protein